MPSLTAGGMPRPELETVTCTIAPCVTPHGFGRTKTCANCTGFCSAWTVDPHFFWGFLYMFESFRAQ